MNKHSGKLVAQQSLIAPLNEELDKIHSAWESQPSDAFLSVQVAAFHQLGNVLFIADLGLFAKLAKLLSVACQRILEGKIERQEAHKILFSSQLLQYELNRFILTGNQHPLLVSLRTSQLEAWLNNDNSLILEQLSLGRFSQKITNLEQASLDSKPLAEGEGIDELYTAWQNACEQLLAVDENDTKILGELSSIAQKMVGLSQSATPQKIWYLCQLWLVSLIANDTPRPSVYMPILNELEEVFLLDKEEAESLDAVIWLENLLIDLYVQIGSLKISSDEAYQFLSSLSLILSNEAMFFPYILGILEGMLFAFARGEVVSGVLEEVKEQFAVRGWSFYESYAAQIIDDINTAKSDPELLMQMQWQINHQIQDLYNAILSTQNAIAQKIGQAAPLVAGNSDTSQDQLGQVRQTLELIKSAFNEYLHTKDTNTLPDSQTIKPLSVFFEGLSFEGAKALSERMLALFEAIRQEQPTNLSWAFAHAASDGLSLFELFLDGLAKEIFDEALLTRADEQMARALLLLNDSVTDDSWVSFETVIDHRVRYDDSGEIVPSFEQESIKLPRFVIHLDTPPTSETQPVSQSNAASSAQAFSSLAVSKDATQALQSEPTLSAAYMAAKAKLKPDSFAFDEDIRDIFVEEAEEVLSEMNELLPSWQMRPDHFAPLKDIRRGFHTLKGSGRMVGAFSIGEMAWSVENLLNRVLEGLVLPSAPLIEFIAQTIKDIPLLIKDYRLEQAPSLDPALIILKATNLLTGQPLLEGAPEEHAFTSTQAPLISEQNDTQGMAPILMGDVLSDNPIRLSTLLDTSDLAETQTHDDRVGVSDELIFDDDLADDDILIDDVVFDKDVEKVIAYNEIDNQSSQPLKNEAPQPLVDELPELIYDDTVLDNVDEHSIPSVLVPFYEEAKAPKESQVGEVDDDIKEIYIEEASEVLETIRPLYESWQNSQDKEMLVEIRRGFHTLKGSGRMVGAATLGELAWAIENLLNRVLDETIDINAGMVALVGDVLADFDSLIGIFARNETEYPNSLALRAAAAHAYSKGLGEAFDYRMLWCAKTQPNVQSSALEQLEQPVALEEETDIKLLSIIQEAKAAIVSAEPVVPADDEEDELCQIFIEEARELLAVVQKFLADNAGKHEVMVSDDVVRVFHTLKGAKGLLPLVAVGEVGAMIEDELHHLQSNDELMTPKYLQALGSSVELIEDHLNAYENNTANDGLVQEELAGDKQMIEGLLHTEDKQKAHFEVASLIEGIDTLLDAELALEGQLSKDEHEVLAYVQTLDKEVALLKSRTSPSKKFQSVLTSLSSAFAFLCQYPKEARNETLVSAILSALYELTGLFDSLAGSMSLRLDPQVIQQLDDEVALGLNAYGLPLPERDEQATQAVPEKAPEIEFVAIDTDPELLEIFLEEALELDYAIDKAFGEWREDFNNTEALKALQRHLHTIKGGTKLVGIASIGDLTHEAEDVYERLINGRLTPSEDWVRIMQSIQDLLSMQIKEVRQHRQSFLADYAIAKLKSFAEAQVLPIGASIPLPVLEEEQVQIQTDTAAAETVIETVVSDSDFEEQRRRSWQTQMPDKDILAVFLEEAEELVETSLEDFGVFRNNTGDLATLQSLQRKLHTIKGGARMVSANGLADLAHNMETVYEDLGNRRRPATKMVIGLLLACHDWITGAITLLKANFNPPTPQPLIEVLESFSRNPDSLESIPVVSLNDELQALNLYLAQQRGRRIGHDISEMPPSEGMFKESSDAANSNEMIRISANLMERMVNLSGEAAINRSRIDMSMAGLTASIEEMGATIQRLHDQLRRMDIELEAQILAQIDDRSLIESGEFDPLEMDQYSSLNQLSKSLAESASDLLDLKSTLLEKTRDSENLLLQLSRTHTDLQDGLMYSRMVPFSRLTPRLERIARQVSSELGKQVELMVINGDDEVDRTILERITSPLEHMLRNAIDHGIEMPEEREVIGKPSTGQVKLELLREGSEILIHLTDDGAGINVEAVKKKAISQGLIAADDKSLSDLDIMQYIFNAGLSTTNVITQISGRGVGMDVVRSEIQQLGGSVSVSSERGRGSRFTMRVPLTVAVSDTLVVRAADRHYAVPLVQIDRVVQVSVRELLDYHTSNNATLDIGGVPYRLRYLNDILLGHDFSETMATAGVMPVILVKNQAGQNLALQVDEIVGSRIEVVVKPLGRQLAHVSGISSATIMGDGSVMFILDMMALIRNARARVAVQAKTQETNKRPVILVVDDSVTVRKVTSRFLEREGFEAVVAKDGVDAIEILQDLTPDLMLLDIEMPRMDGFEVATQVRHNARLAKLPIIMITSRTGEKHRERAFDIGVNDYMGKPFQENELLMRIQEHLALVK